MMWQRVRAFLFWVGLLLGVGLFAGYAWLTQNPDSPYLEEATSWPVVGGLAADFRRAYLGDGGTDQVASAAVGATESQPELIIGTPAAPGRRREDTSSPPVVHSGGESVAGFEPPVRLPQRELPPGLARAWVDEAPAKSPSANEPFVPPPVPRIEPPAPIPALAWRWFLPGQSLYGQATGGEVVATLEALSYLPILERAGGWVKVQFDGRPGWLEEAWQPPHNRRKARQGGMRQRFEPYRAADRQRLVTAKKILGLKKPVGKLGPYELWTDVDDPELLTFLDELAAAVEPAYFARYARLPSGDPKRAAVLFASEADYRRYSPTTMLSDTHVGHAGSGVLAMFVGERPRIDLARTLAHEITHLLDDRALAVNLPSWLEEGLASDLGSVWVESAEVDGGGTLAGDQRDTRRSFVLLGPDLRTLRLGTTLRAGNLPEIAAFLTLESKDFYRGENQGLAYDWGATFVKYLVDGDNGRYRDRFYHFLERIADGFVPNLALFLDSLGSKDASGLVALEADFRSWLERERESAKARIERRAGVEVVD